jgi:hypothetical protein
VHLRVAPGRSRATHAAAQLATAPVLAAAGNAPLFLGHRLWEETRVALFKQAVDERGELPADVLAPRGARLLRPRLGARGRARAVRRERGAARAAAPGVRRRGPRSPSWRAGGVPRLEELRLHHGTVWRWNRAIYDPAEGGHLRIELRALPSGPTLADMLANAAFLLGLTLALRRETAWMLPAFPFEYAERNFYRAAQHGLAATLLWPAPRRPRRAGGRAELVARLLPQAQRGLVEAGVDEAEAARMLARGGRAGRQRPHRRALAAARPARAPSSACPRDEALAALVARYRHQAEGGRPVHEWPEAP